MFTPIRSPKVSDAVVDQIEALILAGVLKPGDQLPSERDLARALDVSRSSLRDGIVKLEARGLLQVRPGAGTCVTDILGPTLTDPLVHLLKDQPEAMLDLLELRQALEEVAVYFAAERATELDVAMLGERFTGLNTPAGRADPRHESAAVAEYYLSVADASHNIALMHVMRGLFNLMRTSIGKSLELIYVQQDAYEHVHRHRARMHQFILTRQAEAAREESHSLIKFVNRTLREMGAAGHAELADSGRRLFTPVSRADVKPSRLSDAVVAQLERLILRGRLKPGSRLPPEPDLAEQFEVSRAVLRDAVVKLEARGLLQTRRGDGMYVCDVAGPTITDPLVFLLENHPEAVFDFLELRRSLEELSAYLAASRSTPEDIEALEQHVRRIENAFERPDPHQDAEFVAGFHAALAEASHNLALVYVMRGLFNLLHKSIRTNLKKLHLEPHSYDLVREHHRAMLQAIASGDPERARQAAHVHISFVNRSLEELDARQRRLEQSQLRYRTLTKEPPAH